MIEHAQPLNWTLSPVEALRRYPADQLITLLHSGRFDARWARWSILQHADEAFRLETDREGKPRASWLQHDGEVREVPVNKPFAALRTALRSGSGLWTGYLGYDLGRWIEHLPRKASERSDWPVVQMQHAPGWLVHDGSTGRWYACGAWRESGYPDLPNLPVDDSSFAAELAAPQFTRGDYEARVQTVKDYIAAGDVFQVNVAQQLSADCTGNTRALYASLAEVSPAWYGAHVELLAAESEPHRTLASISPELFLSLKNGHVITRPIKGTRPASVHPGELLASEKDAAELNMIVDLLRNDLGRVCDCGSVRVTQPRTIEKHPTIHHAVATIEGRLHKSKDLIDLLRATTPGGSITGAPKIRAMQIIDELEPQSRGPYCGAIGYVTGGDATPHACFNIAIRTVQIEQDDRGSGELHYRVGAGIVSDSDPAAEYCETFDKAAAIEQALRLSSASPARSG